MKPHRDLTEEEFEKFITPVLRIINAKDKPKKDVKVNKSHIPQKNTLFQKILKQAREKRIIKLNKDK